MAAWKEALRPEAALRSKEALRSWQSLNREALRFERFGFNEALHPWRAVGLLPRPGTKRFVFIAPEQKRFGKSSDRESSASEKPPIKKSASGEALQVRVQIKTKGQRPGRRYPRATSAPGNRRRAVQTGRPRFYRASAAFPGSPRRDRNAAGAAGGVGWRAGPGPGRTAICPASGAAAH